MIIKTSLSVFFAVGIIIIFGGCKNSLIESMNRSVEYSYEDGIIAIESIDPDFDDYDLRMAFIEGYKKGFLGEVENKPLLITWEDSSVGHAGEEGFEAGVSDALEFIRRGQKD